MSVLKTNLHIFPSFIAAWSVAVITDFVCYLWSCCLIECGHVVFQVLEVLCSLCVCHGVAVRYNQNVICDKLLPDRDLLLQTRLTNRVTRYNLTVFWNMSPSVLFHPAIFTCFLMLLRILNIQMFSMKYSFLCCVLVFMRFLLLCMCSCICVAEWCLPAVELLLSLLPCLSL